MPSPTTQPMEPRSQRVVRLLPNIADKKDMAAALVNFLQQELMHWQADLGKRRKEGEYYLDWLEMNDMDTAETSNLYAFSNLVLQEIPALIKRLKSQPAQPDESDIDQLFSIQQVYVQLCKHYDRIKLDIMEKMEWGSSLQIY